MKSKSCKYNVKPSQYEQEYNYAYHANFLQFSLDFLGVTRNFAIMTFKVYLTQH